MKVQMQLRELAGQVQQCWSQGHVGWALRDATTRPTLEPFLTILSAHIDSFVQVQWNIPGQPVAIVTGEHSDEYHRAWKSLAYRTLASCQQPLEKWITELASTGARQWGLKWSVDPRAALQLYVRGRFDYRLAAKLPGVFSGEPDLTKQASDTLIRLLSYSGKADIRIVGIELSRTQEPTTRHVAYVTMVSTPETAAMVREALGELIAWRLVDSPWIGKWPKVAEFVIAGRIPQTIFISTEHTRRSPAALKVDVGPMHISDIAFLSRKLGIPTSTCRSTLAELIRFGVTNTDQTGLRMQPDGTASLSLYVSRWRCSHD